VVVAVEGNAAAKMATNIIAYAIPDPPKTAGPPAEQ